MYRVNVLLTTVHSFQWNKFDEIKKEKAPWVIDACVLNTAYDIKFYDELCKA